jgi:DNA-binding Lrp family transcriptional regulator
MGDIEYQNSHLAYLIDEFIHDEKDRIILKRKLIDGWSYSEIAMVVHLDRATCCRRVEKLQGKLFKRLL